MSDFSTSTDRGLAGAGVVPASFTQHGELRLWLEDEGDATTLVVVGPASDPGLAHFQGERAALGDGRVLVRAATDHQAAVALRQTLEYLTPRPLGLATSAGLGDRLGLGTPGHVAALRASDPAGVIQPIFAQQSIREMGRTHRSPANVLDDATFGAFRAGWDRPVGADADHQKTIADLDSCLAVGFTFYTIDPGAYVQSAADTVDGGTLQSMLGALPWDTLADTPEGLIARLGDRKLDLGDRQLVLTAPELTRAAVKYGGAVAHVTRLYRHLEASGQPFELEASVDETDSPTTHVEHAYIALELQRLGVHWVSLAPRYVGSFEKGIDYIGDLDALASDLQVHAAIARSLGPYKLSLHSGSDKFSVYPLIVAATGDVVHLKTAGTSYVEALRVIGAVNPPLFRQILELGREHYERDRATYHVSGEVARVPASSAISDAALPDLLDDPHTRQVLHVTFGTALDAYHGPIVATLRAHRAEYDATLERHFIRHLAPFAVGTGAAGASQAGA